MRNRFTKIGAGLAALVALALGGAALASAGQGGSPPTTPAPAVQQDAGTAANGTAEQPGVEQKDGSAVADTDSIQDENGKDDATEQPGAEQKDGVAEQGEGAEASESGSEIPGNDGPGGHADEPGNPNADHQFEGQE